MDKGCVITAGIMVAVCVVAVASIVFSVRSCSKEAAAPAAAREPVLIAPIDWNELDALYSQKKSDAAVSPEPSALPDFEGKVTNDLQKESDWANFKGKFVEWEGEVVAVKKGYSGYTVSIKMNASSPKMDILLSLRQAESARAKKLKKGDRLKFRGRLKSWGSVVRFAMDLGEILD